MPAVKVCLAVDNAAKVLYAIAHYKVIGFSPFSIGSTFSPSDEPISKSYDILQQLTPFILQYQPTTHIEGVLLGTTLQKQEIIIGNYKLTVMHEYTLGWSPGAKMRFGRKVVG